MEIIATKDGHNGRVLFSINPSEYDIQMRTADGNFEITNEQNEALLATYAAAGTSLVHAEGDHTPEIIRLLLTALSETGKALSAARESAQAPAQLDDLVSKAQVRQVAKKYAVQHDWCSVVDEALREMGINPEEPHLRGTIVVEYEFEGEIGLDHIPALRNDPHTFILRHTAIPAINVSSLPGVLKIGDGTVDPSSIELRSWELENDEVSS